MATYTFAFGRALGRTEPAKPQKLPADAFVLGVYPSAVHARWVGPDGDVKCGALAVAPEPHSFWDGADAKERIAAVAAGVPARAGSLLSAGGSVNGPSAQVLVERYLAPLLLDPKKCWITDLHHSYYPSEGNREALADYMQFRRERCPELPEAHLPDRPGSVTPTAERVEELRREFETAAPRWVITLGSEPIAVVLGRGSPLKLADYGRPERVRVWGRDVLLLRLCHPRQAGGLGAHSPEWKSAHEQWMRFVRENGGLSGLERMLAS